MLKYQPTMARTETGEQNNAGWAVSIALQARTWLEGYIRTPYPDEAQRIAKRNRYIGLSAVFATLAIGAGFVAPDAFARTSDYLRDSGIIASTTPIKRTPFTFPQAFPIGGANPGRPGDTFVDLSRPNEVVDAGRVVVINTAPSSLGFTARINRRALTELATSTNLGTAIDQDRTAYILLAPFSLKTANKTQANGFLQAEADMIDRSNELEQMNKISRFLYEGGNFTDNTQSKPVKSITPISLVDSLYVDAGRNLGSRLTPPANLFVGVFPAGFLGGGGGPTDEDVLGYQLSKKIVETMITASGKTKPDPKNLTYDLTRFIDNNPLVTVAQFEKSKFDKEWLISRVALTPKPTPRPTTIPESYLDSIEECTLSVHQKSSESAPSTVILAVGVGFKHPGNRYITAAEWDFNGDGIWDTPFTPEQYRLQTHHYENSGVNRFGARVQFSDGGETVPCFGEFTLK